MDIERPDFPSKCTWKPSNSVDTVHSKRPGCADRKCVLPDILHAIGSTPMVRLNNIPKSLGIKCELLAKCEFLNPGGSVKDRIGFRMVQDAEEKGLLKPGYTIIEPTSGNTGIGLAMAAACKGYRCIIVMPQKMSNEKAYTLQALGAEIIRTPTEAAWDDPTSHIAVSQKLQREIPNSIILNQYTNPGNPLAHYDQTATEIWEQCGGKVDYIVVGTGTGGTASGIGRKFKELSPSTVIVGIDPEGSILAEPLHLNDSKVTVYEVEGIGYDFVPTVLDRSVIDSWVKTSDKESFIAARRLIREEGLLCGGSSGAAMSAALKIAKDIPEGKRVVVVLPDGIRNYMTKFVSDYWMEYRKFMDTPAPSETNKWWWNIPVSQLQLEKPLVISDKLKCREAVKVLKGNEHVSVVLDDKGDIEGIITPNSLLSATISGELKPNDSIKKVSMKRFTNVSYNTSLGTISRVLELEAYTLVVDDQHNNKLLGFVTQLDLLEFITNDEAKAKYHANGSL